ncbi:hypothetical protein BDQ12DRAFT_638462 [Crucibulum laeve]|uniref:G-protein coupled receptors family 1 profile domain-containing protein n=1 Tax=Crucibulum laeve TaxID=68775 RepID=A0A5C3LV88_9AGAR|nr:hypothetical protein BDQ12DRAFT_638462 [Crucibulum laeve]
MPSSSLPITTAQLCALFTESIVYGIYLVTCGYCAQQLFMVNGRCKRLGEYHWPMVIVAILLLIFSTLDVAMGFYHNLWAFVLYTGTGGALEAFHNISFWVNVIKTTNVLVTANIGDGVLIYRCWIVHNKSWLVVVFSTILWLTSVACTIRIVYVESTIHARDLLRDEKSITAPMITFWTLTIVINFVTTALLVTKIWRVDRRTRRCLHNSELASHTQHSSPLRYAIRIVMESGILYTTFAFISFVAYVTGGNWVFPVTGMEVPVVGIAFNLIIIRAAARHAEENTSSQLQPSNSIFFRHQTNCVSLSSRISASEQCSCGFQCADSSQFSSGSVPLRPQKPSEVFMT